MSLYPDDYVNSTYDVDFQELYNQGYRLALFDVDNTLVPHGAPADDRAIKLFSDMKEMGWKFCFLSNNKEPRVKSFCEAVQGDGYIYKANKPSPAGYEKAMQDMQIASSATIFFGDQLFTDVWGASNAGVRSVLVKPVKKWHEEIQIVLKRLLEAVILIPYAFGKSCGSCPTK